ncbi:MAG: hypothetical protein AB7P04_01075 [Bacteriovoracia bacterium]
MNRPNVLHRHAFILLAGPALLLAGCSGLSALNAGRNWAPSYVTTSALTVGLDRSVLLPGEQALLTLDDQAAADIDRLNLSFAPESLASASSGGNNSGVPRSPILGAPPINSGSLLDLGTPSEEVIQIDMGGIAVAQVQDEYGRFGFTWLEGFDVPVDYSSGHQTSLEDAESFVRIRRLSAPQFAISGPSLARLCRDEFIDLFQTGLPSTASARSLCQFFGHRSDGPSLPTTPVSSNNELLQNSDLESGTGGGLTLGSYSHKGFSTYYNPLTGRFEGGTRMVDPQGRVCIRFTFPPALKVRFVLSLNFLRASTNERLRFQLVFDYTDIARHWSSCVRENVIFTANDEDATAMSDRDLANSMGNQNQNRGPSEGGSGSSSLTGAGQRPN